MHNDTKGFKQWNGLSVLFLGSLDQDGNRSADMGEIVSFRTIFALEDKG